MHRFIWTLMAGSLAASPLHALDIPLTPANNLQAAINQASSGDRLLLGPGFYNATVFIDGKSLIIEGAGPDQTEISAAFLNNTAVRIANVSGAGVTIRNLTISDGVTPSSSQSNVGYPSDGGGISASSSVITLENCHFRNNLAGDDGGGVTLISCTTLLTGCRFEDNTTLIGTAGALYQHLGTLEVIDSSFIGNSSPVSGGAFYTTGAYTFRNTTFADNFSTGGSAGGGAVELAGGSGIMDRVTFVNNMAAASGAISCAPSSTTAIFESCTFTSNVATSGTSGGGAVYSNGQALRFSDTTFTRNHSGAYGGAVYKVGANTLTITRSRFHGNRSTRGGAVYTTGAGSTTVDHSLFVGNSASVYGGDFYITGSASAIIRHCTMYGSGGSNPVIGGTRSSGSTTVRNCMAWNITPSSTTASIEGSHSVFYSNIQQSDGTVTVPGTGNINQTPLFMDTPHPGADMEWGSVDDHYGDLRLAPGSGGIDAGDSPSSLTFLVDLAGASRCVDDPDSPNFGVIAWFTCTDMGAYEYQPPVVGSSCPGDATGEGLVNFEDLTEVLENWNTACEP